MLDRGDVDENLPNCPWTQEDAVRGDDAVTAKAQLKPTYTQSSQPPHNIILGAKCGSSSN